MDIACPLSPQRRHNLSRGGRKSVVGPILARFSEGIVIALR
jgi:hypothetical protein